MTLIKLFEYTCRGADEGMGKGTQYIRAIRGRLC